jgi:molecular chaperone HscB
MNYFELFGLPIGFQVDTIQLRKAFMEIQRSSHPDKFAQASPEEQEAALEKSSMANKGFTLLNNKALVIPYVLELKGYMESDEKFALDPEFLMEMMELNEAWMDADDEDMKQKVKQRVNTIQTVILTPVKAVLDAPCSSTFSQEEMSQVKEYYYKQKYLNRILADFHE